MCAEVLHDRDIREDLFDYLELTCGKIRIIEEKQIGRTRADVVMVTPDALVGIEIKSDADTYARLSRQVRDYDKCFDYNMLVVGSRHALHAPEHVPEHWGILSAEMIRGSMDFYQVRGCQRNNKVQTVRKLSMLWRPELVHILELNNLPKYKSKSKKFVVDKIAEKVDAGILDPQISEELFQRDYTTIAEQIEQYKKT